MENEKKNPTSVAITAQYIKDISFENPNAPFSFQGDKQPEFNMNFDLNVQAVKEDLYEVVLGFTIDAKEEDKKSLVIEIKYAGLVAAHSADKKELELILLVQVPTMLFPYVRRIIANLSMDGGFPPINLQPLDFYSLYMSKVNQEQQVPANDKVN